MVGRTHINDVDALAAQFVELQRRLASLERMVGHVPVGRSWTGYPAEAGPWIVPYETHARFGNTDAPDVNGLVAYPDGEVMIHIPSGKSFHVNDEGIVVASFQRYAIQLDPWWLGNNQVHGSPTLIKLGADQATGYTILAYGDDTLVNAKRTVELRSNNEPKLVAAPTEVSSSVAFRCAGALTVAGATTAQAISTTGLTSSGGVYGTYLSSSGNVAASGSVSAVSVLASGVVRGRSAFTGDWNSWGILAEPNGGTQAFCGMILQGVAAAGWRLTTTQGEQMCAANWNSSAFTPIGALRFDVMSTATIKRGVRSLRPERERINVRLDPAADTVTHPDVMALRPVAFRHKQPAQRPGGEEFDGIIGAESKRERLGLIAEEVQHVIPSAVSHDADGACIGIDYSQITVALLDHVQRLTDEIATLRYRVAELEGEQP